MRGRALLRDPIGIGVALCVLAAPGAAAQDWPTRPVILVVPFAAGGGADGSARVLAGGLSEVLGQQVIVENVGGAGGTIGGNRVRRGRPTVISSWPARPGLTRTASRSTNIRPTTR